MGRRYILPTTRVTLKRIPGISGLWSSPNPCVFSRAWLGNLGHTVSDNSFFFFFLTASLNPMCFLPTDTLTDSSSVLNIAPGPEEHEDEENRSLSLKTQICMRKQACKQQWEEREVLKWRQRHDGKWCRWRGTNSVLGSTEVWGDSLCEEQSLWLFNIIQHLPRVNHCAVHL